MVPVRAVQLYLLLGRVVEYYWGIERIRQDVGGEIVVGRLQFIVREVAQDIAQELWLKLYVMEAGIILVIMVLVFYTLRYPPVFQSLTLSVGDACVMGTNIATLVIDTSNTYKPELTVRVTVLLTKLQLVQDEDPPTFILILVESQVIVSKLIWVVVAKGNTIRIVRVRLEYIEYGLYTAAIIYGNDAAVVMVRNWLRDGLVFQILLLSISQTLRAKLSVG